MENEECDLSCDPANPRRHEVPGPRGVKSVTEDCADVGNQASASVNTTGKRIFIQQAFHPSLFTRTRSSSLGNIPQIPPPTQTTLGKNLELITSKPPDWQRVPVPRNHKRKKISQSPSPEGLKTQNRYKNLPVDEKDSSDPIEKRPSKPPPIILYGIEDVNKLTELLEPAADPDLFTFKIVNRNQLRVSCKDITTYKKLITVVRENGLIGHTFNLKDQRCFRIVIKNLHHTTPHSSIAEEIERTGNNIYGEIINAKYGPDKKPTSTFFVNIDPGPNNKAVKDIKYIYHQSVVIEDPKKRTTIPQCQRCQQYGHSKNYCMRPYRCVKCALGHKTADCPKKDRNTPAKCALCEGAHPANYKGCAVYREILARRMPQRPTHKNTTSPPLETKNTTHEKPETPRESKSNGTYAERLKKTKEPQPETGTYNKIEEMLLKQSEQFDLILQQMSTLMSLITTLLGKISK